MELKETKKVNKIHVQRRIKDWKNRVDVFYSEIKKWLKDKPEFTLIAGHPMQMFEELMQQFSIKPEQINTADLFKESKLVLTFKPKGLWVIGTNGLIDIISRKGSYILVDYSEQFNTPKWYIYTNKDKNNGKPFTKEELLNIIS